MFKVGDRVIASKAPDAYLGWTGTIIRAYSLTAKDEWLVMLDKAHPAWPAGCPFIERELELFEPPKPGSVEAYIRRELHNV